MRRLILATLLVAIPAIGHTSEVERRIVEAVDASNDDALELLETIVNINSGSMNLAGVRKVGDVLTAEFEKSGFEVRWIDGAPFQRAGHLVAEWPPGGGDTGRPHFLLIGHLDTVFEPHSPFQRFERLSDAEAAGPGTTDMKGGDVVMLFALRALASAGVLDELQLTVVMTGDEEKPGWPLERARDVLFETADRADVAIGFEDGDSDPGTAVISRRGSSGWRLDVTGTPAHSSQVFSKAVGAGAIYEAARILEGFREALADEEYLTYNPGIIVGGTDASYEFGSATGRAFGKANVVAQTAIVSGDLRALSPEQLERARSKMRSVVENNLPGTSAEVEFFDGYPPLAPTEGNRKLLALYSLVSEDLGFGPVEAVNPLNAGAADVSFTSGRVDAAIDGIGLMGRGGHTVGEVADLSTLPSQTKRAAVFLHRLGRKLAED